MTGQEHSIHFFPAHGHDMRWSEDHNMRQQSASDGLLTAQSTKVILFHLMSTTSLSGHSENNNKSVLLLISKTIPPGTHLRQTLPARLPTQRTLPRVIYDLRACGIVCNKH